MTVGSQAADRLLGVTLCCEEVFVSTNLGEFEIELAGGAHELKLIHPNALPAFLDFEIDPGSVLTLPPIDLIPDAATKGLVEGDRCPVHRDVVLREVTLLVDYGLPSRPEGYRERSGRFPFPGIMAWGGCRPGRPRMADVLRCEACYVGDRELFAWALKQRG